VDGLIFDVDLLAPDILLDDLRVLDYVFADPYLLLGPAALLYHNDLFFGDRDAHFLRSQRTEGEPPGTTTLSEAVDRSEQDERGQVFGRPLMGAHTTRHQKSAAHDDMQ
jgi:hypothetical protein